MDLTHETFVHGSSIRQQAVAEAPFDVTHGDRTATVTRWMRNIDPPPFWAGHSAARQGRPLADHPLRGAVHDRDRRGGRAHRHRRARGRRSQGVNGFVLNTMTPETGSTCHYFWAFVRNWDLGNQGRPDPQIAGSGCRGVFREDEVILEAQQKAIEANPDHVFYNLNIDAGSMWARRLIDRMVAAEGATPTGLRAA